MGQYYKIVNLTKKQFLHPPKFGDGLKLCEFGASGYGTMLGLAVLLANSNGRGSGDLMSQNPIIGSWAGDSIVIAGDYGEPGDVAPDAYKRTQAEPPAQPEYTDISTPVLIALCDDDYFKEEIATMITRSRRREFDPALLVAAGINPAPVGVGK